MTTVLIADDETAVSGLLRDLLTELGYTVAVAANGVRALELLHAAADPPALVLSDVMMPQLDGVELAHAMKASPRLRHIPVILMSAAHQRTPDGVADAFVAKPFDIDRLIELVRRFLPGDQAHP